MHFLYIAASLAFMAEASQQPIRPNDLNFTAAEATKHNCGTECQEYLAGGMEGDKAEFGAMPFDYDFYATASNFSHAVPGDLLKIQPINTSFVSDIPNGITLFRIQYASVDVDNATVPVTGFIALPFVRPAGGRFDLVAFAHGTIGYVSSCAPSSSANLFDYHTWTLLLTSGYAVVATDYAGLGNNHTAHKYNLPTVQSDDVYFSVMAARKALPGLFTPQWSAIGHSEGGGAVWGLSENARVAHHPAGYVGAVAISPSPRMYDLAQAGFAAITDASAPSALSSYAPFIAATIHSAFPHQHLNHTNSILAPGMLSRLPLIDSLQLCFIGAFALSLSLPTDQVFTLPPPPAALSLLEQTQARYGAGVGRRASRSLLVVQSTADMTVDAAVTRLAWQGGCAAGNAIELSLYAGLDHTATFAATSPDWLGWMAARFRGEKDMKGCAMRRHNVVDLGAAYTPLDSSFFDF